MADCFEVLPRPCVLALVVFLAACPSPTGSPEPDPEPDGFVVGGPDSPWRDDFDAAWAQLDPDVQALAAPVEDGALAGTFATFSVSATLVNTVVMGIQRGGGVNYRLVQRTWDDEEKLYRQTSWLCGGYNFEVASVINGVPESTYRAVPESVLETVRVDPETGLYLADDHVQLWGLRDLPDPLTTPLPANLDEAGMSPHAERIYDMDDDGNPGITVYITQGEGESAVMGEVYAIQRKLVDLTGVTTSADRSTGFATTGYSSLALGAVPDLLSLVYQGSAEPHPDAWESWFEEIRIDSGSDCDDVMAEVEGGLFDESAAPWRRE